MSELVKRYKVFLILIMINVLILVFDKPLGQKSFQITWNNTLEMLLVLPPIFILLGLLDVWVERETIIKYMGNNSSFLGILLSFLLGSAAAGPLYAAFPIAGVLLKKGSSLSNVLIFIGAWSTTKIPLLLFEMSAMGWEFMFTRFIVNIIGILLIAYITERVLKEIDIKEIYDNALTKS
ncbi:MAG: permease [Clostridia bacterium]|nr:permease [Clostridia bacterium]